MSALRQDFVYALRSLRKQPGFTAVAIAMLAIGIGATVAIFALTFAVLYEPFVPVTTQAAADLDEKCNHSCGGRSACASRSAGPGTISSG
jgi:hypothetical protein